MSRLGAPRPPAELYLKPHRCAALVTYSKGQRWKQCSRYRGFGPGERYCRFHAERQT